MSTPLPPQFKIIDLLCDLIRGQLNLSDDQVWIYNQKRKIPNDDRLYVIVSRISSRPFAVNSTCKDDEAGNFTEFQTINALEVYGISLLSRDESALDRAHEAILALAGTLSQQTQELYNFNIGQLPTSFHDTSFLEASANLFRQDIVINSMRAYEKRRVIQYFDKFNIPPEINVNP